MKIWFEFDTSVTETWHFRVKQDSGNISNTDTKIDVLRPFYFRARAGVVSMFYGKTVQKFDVPGLPDTDEDVQVSAPGEVAQFKSKEHGTEHFASRYTASADPNEVQIGGDHYKGVTFQPWDWARTLPDCAGLGYYEVSAISYIARFRKKGGVEDLEKVLHYIDKMLFCFKLGQYRNPCTASLLRIREFNRQNSCDRFQSEAIQLLVLWRNEEELLETKKIVEELIQVQRDDFNHHHEPTEFSARYPLVVPPAPVLVPPAVDLPALGLVTGEGTGAVTPAAEPREPEPAPPPMMDVATAPLPPYKPLKPALKIPASWNEDSINGKLIDHE